MRLLRIKLFQEYASYRTPWSFENVETYPLPPYSSVLGLIHAVLGARETITGVSLSVQGRFGGLIRNYVRYRKYKKGEVESYPILVSELYDVEVLLHVAASDDLLEDLQKAFLNPPKYLHLGRYEDLVKVEEVKSTDLEYRTVETLPFDAYIPRTMTENYDLANRGVLYALPSYYRKKNDKRVFDTVLVSYVQSGEDINNELPSDEDGYPVFLMGGKV